MALGVRSYGNSLLTQNIYNPDNLSDRLPALKAFAYRILEPTLTCTEEECGTTIGRLLQVPEASLVGLIKLDTDQVITDQDTTDWINAGIYTVRVRDTSSCLTVNGFCRNCGRGYLHRIGAPGTPPLGENLAFSSSARSYQNYIAKSFSGASMGWLPLAADPLPSIPDNWSSITSHEEMDKLCRILRPLGVAQDDYNYLLSVEDLLERALLLIGTYGVFGYA